MHPLSHSVRPTMIPTAPLTMSLTFSCISNFAILCSYLSIHGPSLLGIPSPCLDGFLRPDLGIAMLCAVRSVEVNPQHLPNVHQMFPRLSQAQPELIVPRRLHLGIEP